MVLEVLDASLRVPWKESVTKLRTGFLTHTIPAAVDFWYPEFVNAAILGHRKFVAEFSRCLLGTTIWGSYTPSDL